MRSWPNQDQWYVVLPDKLSFESIDDFSRQQVGFDVARLFRPKQGNEPRE